MNGDPYIAAKVITNMASAEGRLATSLVEICKEAGCNYETLSEYERIPLEKMYWAGVYKGMDIVLKGLNCEQYI